MTKPNEVSDGLKGWVENSDGKSLLDPLSTLYRNEIKKLIASHQATKNIQTEINILLNGIDKDALDRGWWETSTGVVFGSQILAKINALFPQPKEKP